MTTDYRAKSWYSGLNAQQYDVKREAKTDRFQAEDQRIKEYLDKLPDHSRVLDVPIGTGRFLKFYKDRNFNVTGIDISRDMLGEAEKKASKLGMEVRLLAGDATDMPLPDRSVDYIVSNKFVKWLPNIEHVKLFLTGCARVAIRGALVEIKTEKERNWLQSWGRQRNRESNSQRYRAEDIYRICASCGFVVDRVVPLGLPKNSSHYFWLTRKL